MSLSFYTWTTNRHFYKLKCHLTRKSQRNYLQLPSSCFPTQFQKILKVSAIRGALTLVTWMVGSNGDLITIIFILPVRQVDFGHFEDAQSMCQHVPLLFPPPQLLLVLTQLTLLSPIFPSNLLTNTRKMTLPEGKLKSQRVCCVTSGNKLL